LDGQTAIRRVTIFVLAINAPDFLAVREVLIREQVFPLKKTSLFPLPVALAPMVG